MGTVQKVQLTDDLQHVLVTVRMNKEAKPLLNDRTKFWVVKPRFFAGSVSGLQTLISGAYIEMFPSRGGTGKPTRNFVGLENPPVLQTEVPGRTFLLKAPRIGSITLGSPVFFRDLQVGEVLGWDVANMAATKPYTGTSWYRTTFDVDAPKGHDITLGLQFGDPSVPRSPTAKYRVLIFVNGWNMGQFIAHVGPQRTFMLPPGIVNMAGKNTLALAVTSDGQPGNALEQVKLVTVRNVRGGVPTSLVPAPDYKP
jgi:hypothetical protein